MSSSNNVTNNYNNVQYVLIGQKTANNSTSITFTSLTSSYSTYEFYLNNIIVSTTSDQIYLRSISGSTVQTAADGGYVLSYLEMAPSSTPSTSSAGTATNLPITQNNLSSAGAINANVFAYGIAYTAGCTILSTAVTYDGANYYTTLATGFYFNSLTPNVTGVGFYLQTGSFLSGTFTCYGAVR